jgi:hypothetical protein
MLKPTFESICTDFGGKQFYIVELRKSSILAIRSARDFAKIVHVNSRMWLKNTLLN